MNAEQWAARMREAPRNRWDELYQKMGQNMALEVSRLVEGEGALALEEGEYLFRRAAGQLDLSARKAADKVYRRARGQR